MVLMATDKNFLCYYKSNDLYNLLCLVKCYFLIKINEMK